MHTDELLEVVFGLEHMVAEFFWNIVFFLGVLIVSKAKALRKIHKYIDDKHEVKHEDGIY